MTKLTKITVGLSILALHNPEAELSFLPGDGKGIDVVVTGPEDLLVPEATAQLLFKHGWSFSDMNLWVFYNA